MMRKIIVGLAACMVTAALAAPADVHQDALAEANSALQSGEATRALSLLQTIPQTGPQAASAKNVECRVRFTLEQWNAAAKACAEAVRLDGQNSFYRMWLGRALGQQASNASFLSAYSLGKKTGVEFQKAVQLDPHNAAALSDLGEFYVDAPGIVGGGVDKAKSVALELDRVDPARAAVLRGRIASARKDWVSTERYYKKAIELSAHPSRQWATLASFYRHQKEWTQMEWAVRNCAKAAAKDPHSGVALFNGASVLVQAKRNPELAIKMLEDYLKSPSKTEEGPAYQAHIWLARLKAQMGDTAGSQHEQAAAEALAGAFLPRKGSAN